MSSSSYWNNTFHFNSFIGKFDKFEEAFEQAFEQEEKNQNISMTMNTGYFNLSGEMQDTQEMQDIQEMQIQLPSNIKENEININEPLNLFSKKDIGFDKSSYSIEQNFNENSHLNLEEEFEKENKDKIGKDTGIEPIIENGFEEEENNSFFHENNYFIQGCDDSSISLGINNNTNNNNIINNNIMNMTVSNDTKLDYFIDENELLKIKKNLISLKFSKNNNSISYNNSTTKENTFNNNSNKSVLNDNKKIFNVTKQGDDFLSSDMKLNMSSCLLSYKPIRGRKKLLLDGIKTEIIDKTFLREFKKYLKSKKKEYGKIFEEDQIFWKEFLGNTSPPFYFSSGGEKIEFKSYNKKLLRYIFSKPSANKLYNLFVNEKKDIDYHQILSKRKVKKINYQTLAFYMFYRKNLNKLYSQEYSANEITIDELDFNNISCELIDSSFQ